MLRLAGISLALATVVLPTPTGVLDAASDIRALVAAARGASPAICSLAARSVWNGGWGSDAPATPLPRMEWRRDRREALSSETVKFLLENLAVDDPCVREVAVRLVAEGEDAAVTPGLVQRLGAPDSSLRVVAALGLGLSEPKSAVDPLIRATRDASSGVRANAVWALGRIGDGRAVKPVTSTLNDRSRAGA